MTGRRFALGVVAAITLAVPASAAVRSDFDGDGKADVLWRNEPTGRYRVWLMNGTAITASERIGREADRNWLVQTAADFTGDGKADILWRHALSGESRLWVMSALAVTRVAPLPPLADTDWRVAGAADFTGDGQADILWRHDATGENMLWPVAGGIAGAPLAITTRPDLGWRVAGVGDLNGDGRADVLWRHVTSGDNQAWLMDGATVVSSGSLPPLTDSGWAVADLADFDGDDKCDVLWRHGQRGDNALWMMDGLTLVRAAAVPGVPDPDWRVGMAADVSGDGKADILWRQLRLGLTYVWLMDGETRLARARLDGQTADAGWAVAFHPPPAAGSTLFVATLLPEGGAVTTATGAATLLLAADRRSAKLTLSFSGLTSTEIAAHVHGPADPGGTAPPVFSLPLGTFADLTWAIEPTGGLSVDDQLAALETGRLYVNVHTSAYPSGEIRGHFRAVPGSSPLPPPPNPAPAAPTTQAEARRFLEQASMGPTQALADRVLDLGYGGFIDEQFTQPPSTYLDFVSAAPTLNDAARVSAFRTRFYMNALNGPDQLRQRVAFALSQIVVVSARDIFDGPGMAVYADILGRNAFGSFRQLLDEITLNPAMGNYLDMVNNDKPNPVTGRTANENYARELLQLFSIGVFALNPNGTLALSPDANTKLSAAGSPVPTYEQDAIEGFARVFTGWTYDRVPPNPPPTSFNFTPYYLAPMVLIPGRHDIDAKELLDGVVLPGGQTGAQDLAAALDQVFNHPNVGPFIARQLIQHLVTSNPSPGYVARVAQAFDGAGPYGTGARGDMRAVVKAVLLDVEARRDPATVPDFGRLQDPALFVTRTLRSLEATGQGYGLQERVSPMGQSVFSPPTVFSFYQPDYQVPGTTLLGPPFQIYTESTAIRRANFVNTVVFGTVPLPSYAPPGSTTASIDLTPWINLAGNPAALVDDLSLRLMHGAMPADMRARVIQAVTAVAAANPTYRAQTAVYLTATSAQYDVQR
jgi:uncharacterized protein (DUF1800 family)